MARLSDLFLSGFCIYARILCICFFAKTETADPSTQQRKIWDSWRLKQYQRQINSRRRIRSIKSLPSRIVKTVLQRELKFEAVNV